MNQPLDEQPQFGIREMIRQPVIRFHLFVGVSGLVVCHAQMASRGGDLGSFVAVLIGLAGLLLRWAISPAVFLILITYLLIDPNFEKLTMQSGRHPRSGDIVSDVLLCVSVLAYLVAQYRLFSLTRQSMPVDPPPRRKGQPEPSVPRRPLELIADRELTTAVAFGLGAVLFGLMAWSTLGRIDGGRLEAIWGIQRMFARCLLLLWVVGAAAASVTFIFRYIALRRMSRLQARLMLQDMFWQETRREQERIYRWRRWAQSK